MNRKPLKQVVAEHQKLAEHLLGIHFEKEFDSAAKILKQAVCAGKKVLICGNGGSAAESQHLAGEMVGRFLCERSGFAAIALTTDSSVLTSVANDYSFDRIFARQIEALGAPGDILVAFSTSGRSRNVLEAAKAAKKRGMLVLALTGRKPNPLSLLADTSLTVPSSSTPRIQEIHAIIVHLLCLSLEQK